MVEYFSFVKRLNTVEDSIFYSIINYKNEILGFGRRNWNMNDVVINTIKLNKDFDILDADFKLFRGEDPRCFIHDKMLYVFNNLCNRMTLTNYDKEITYKIPLGGKNLSFISRGDKIYIIHYIKPFHLYCMDMKLGTFSKVDVMDDNKYDNLEEPLYRGGTPGYKINDDEYFGYGHKTYKDENDILKHDIFKWVVKFQYTKPLILIENIEQPMYSKNICDPTSVIEIDNVNYLITAETDKPWFVKQDYVTNVYRIGSLNTQREYNMFGKVKGRFFLEQDLGIIGDNAISTFTLSELIETYPHWQKIVEELRNDYDTVNLCTMFETNDIHPEIIEKMKLFDKVIVPYDYLKDILSKHGVECKALNSWTSSFIRSKPEVIHKTRDPSKLIFLYNGTNDVRKNVTTLTRIFANALEGTEHLLIVKTNKPDNLVVNKNIRLITERLSNDRLSSLFNLCDYCVTCTRGEGVGLLHLEAQYFNKPIISHDQGVFKQLGVDIIPLPYSEVDIDYTHVPEFLKKVFYGKWWEINENESIKVIKKIISR